MSPRSAEIPASEEAERPLLLDTPVWIWLVNGSEGTLSSASLAQLRRASRAGNLLLSAISVWELGMLEAQKRLTLTMECRAWVERALDAPGIRLAKLSPDIAIESSRLPGHFSGDHADRVILATARVLGATIVTRDKEILGYAKEHQLPAVRP